MKGIALTLQLVNGVLTGYTWRPSSISAGVRDGTYGVTHHYTVGREPGDIVTLDGPNVDCFAYLAKDGDRYQFTHILDVTWHALDTANHFCIGVEFEGSGEEWTPKQHANAVELMAFLCQKFYIPVVHCDPSGDDLSTFHGLFDHRDLTFGGENVDGNNHTDGARPIGGWDKYLSDIRAAMQPVKTVSLRDLPYTNSLRLSLAGKTYAGWAQAIPAIVWVSRNVVRDPDVAMSYKGPNAKPGDKPDVWRGPNDVRNLCIHLVRQFHLDRKVVA